MEHIDPAEKHGQRLVTRASKLLRFILYGMYLWR